MAQSKMFLKNARIVDHSLYAWHFAKKDLIELTPSRLHGIAYDEELRMRQKASRCIYELTKQLTRKQGHRLATGAAAVMLQRFFKFHSFKIFDFRDIAAVCLFIAGKTEDSVWQLKYIVPCWWGMKFNTKGRFDSRQQYLEACDLFIYLEEVVLKTLAFDINIPMPHKNVLSLMSKIGHSQKAKQICRTAYYTVSEMLLVTDWSLRYSTGTIAAACINIAAFFQDAQIRKIAPAEFQLNWYKIEDPATKRADIEEMTYEFMKIFSNKSIRFGSLLDLDPKEKVKSFFTPSLILPPPPPPPVLNPVQPVAPAPAPAQVQPSASGPFSGYQIPKKVSMDEYKRRKRSSDEAEKENQPSKSSQHQHKDKRHRG